MKKITFLFFAFVIFHIHAQTNFSVNSQATFNAALNSATTGDTIEWQPGSYSNIFMEIDVTGITVQAEAAGSVIFNGSSRVEINSDNVTFAGLQFVGGNILGGTSTVDQTVITIDGSDVVVTNVNISEYTCWKYLRIRDVSQRTEVSYSNFENRLNYADQNIFQVDVSPSQPGFHHIHHCSYKDFSGVTSGGDDGVEPIRIGASTQATFSSKTVVEYCYFTGCEGDGEIISHKATDCIYRYNTFEGNVISELVLRHGDNAIVYGNFFINGGRGIRVREGSGHLIFNNYFGNLDDRAIYLVSSNSDPVDNIIIAYNTVVDCQRIRLSDTPLTTGEVFPTDITLINNIFSDPKSSSGLFRDETGLETWIGNIADSSGDMGITLPASGVTYVDPELSLNSESLYQLASSSPAINASADDSIFPFDVISQFDYDNTIVLDVLASSRPTTVTMKDVGCQEYAAAAVVQPHATEENTGTSYVDGILSTVSFEELNGTFNFYPNPLAANRININFSLEKATSIKVDVYGLSGKKLSTLVNNDYGVGAYNLNKEINLASGIYLLRTEFSVGNNSAIKIEKLLIN